VNDVSRYYNNVKVLKRRVTVSATLVSWLHRVAMKINLINIEYFNISLGFQKQTQACMRI
jgi:hypothetical protein